MASAHYTPPTSANDNISELLSDFVGLIHYLYTKKWCQSIVNYSLALPEVTGSVSMFDWLHSYITNNDNLDMLLSSNRCLSPGYISSSIRNIGSCDYVQTIHIFNPTVIGIGTKKAFGYMDDVPTTTETEYKIKQYISTTNNTIRSFFSSLSKKISINYKRMQTAINTQSVTTDSNNDTNGVSFKKCNKRLDISIHDCKVISMGRSIIPNCIQFEFVTGSRIMVFSNNTVQIILGKKNLDMAASEPEQFNAFVREVVSLSACLVELELLHGGTFSAISELNSLMSFVSTESSYDNLPVVLTKLQTIEKEPLLSLFVAKSINIKYMRPIKTVSIPRVALRDGYKYNHKLNFFKGNKCNAIGVRSKAEIEEVIKIINGDKLSTDSIIDEVLKSPGNRDKNIVDVLAKAFKLTL